MGRLQVNEILDQVSAIPDMDEKIKAMDKHFKEEPYLWGLLRMAVQPQFKITRLESGFPKNFKPEKDLPTGVSDTNIATEFRRIQNFAKGGPLEMISVERLESMWVTMLQGLHYEEAVIMTMVKDQNLLEKYPDFWVILPALGIETCINKSIESADLPSVETVTVPPVEAAPAKKPKKGKKDESANA